MITLSEESPVICKTCHHYGNCDFMAISHTEATSGCRDYLDASSVRIIPETGIGDLSDGYHTFNELYHHRAVLFSVICNTFADKAWKSRQHDTGDMFDGMFIVGIETPEGQATYHYNLDPYWDMFKVKELEKAPVWDGHTPDEAIKRIAALHMTGNDTKHGTWDYYSTTMMECSVCGRHVPRHRYAFCPHCGSEMTKAKVEVDENSAAYWQQLTLFDNKGEA